MKEVIHRRDAEGRRGRRRDKDSTLCAPFAFLCASAVKINIIYTHSKLNHYSFTFEFDIACPIP
jgi:hypothetical protein